MIQPHVYEHEGDAWAGFPCNVMDAILDQMEAALLLSIAMSNAERLPDVAVNAAHRNLGASIERLNALIRTP